MLSIAMVYYENKPATHKNHWLMGTWGIIDTSSNITMLENVITEVIVHNQYALRYNVRQYHNKRSAGQNERPLTSDIITDSELRIYVKCLKNEK